MQYLRGFAAVAVLLYHASHYLLEFRQDGRFLPLFSGFWGGYGVAVFFALSGYLMAEVVERDSPARFLISRVTRIYPLMLMLVALSAVVFALIGKPRGINALALTLIPSGPRGYFLGVEWTLLYEMAYYVGLFLVGFVGLARYRSAIVVFWLVTIAAAYVVGPGRAVVAMPTLSEIPLGIVNLPFVLGFLISGAGRKAQIPPFLIVPAVLVAIAAFFAPDEHFRLLAGLSASLLVAASVRTPPEGAVGRLGRFGARLGDASYALYLCHVPVILILDHVLGPALPTAFVWVLWVVVALGLSLLLGPVDIGMHGLLKRAVNAASPRRLDVVALAFTAAFIGIGAYTERDNRIDNAQLAQARQILAGPAVAPGSGVKVAIDEAARIPHGAWVLRGYVIDLDRPELATHFALRQNGRVIALTGMRRMRTATALALGRPDLKKLRFGFALMLPDGFSCANGPVEGVATFEDGRSVPVPPGALATMCP